MLYKKYGHTGRKNYKALNMNAALLAEFDKEIIGFRVWNVIIKAMQPFKNY